MAEASGTDVSVVIPTRDRPGFLARSLATALAQRDVSLELIVVHDGPDRGGLAPAKASSDPRVSTLELEEQGGVSAARNAGVDRARGEWVAFLDDDDLWSPEKLRGQLEAVDSSSGLAYSAVIYVDQRARLLGYHDAPDPAGLHGQLLERNAIPAGSSNVLARRRSLKGVGGFDPEFHHLADWDAWIRLAAVETAAADRSATVAYVQHPGARSLSPAKELRAEFDRLAQKHSHAGGPGFDRAAFIRWVALTQARAGRRAAAAALYLQTARAQRSGGDLLRAGWALTGLPGPRRRRRVNEPWIGPPA